MYAIENFISYEVVQKIGWVLLHFIWQAAAVAFVLTFALRIMRRFSANTRYIAACFALLIVVALPFITMQFIKVETPPAAIVEMTPLAIEPAITQREVTFDTPAEAEPAKVVYFEPEPVVTKRQINWKEKAVTFIEPKLSAIVTLWLLGVFALAIWHLGGYAQLQKLRRKMVKQVDSSLNDKLKVLAQKLGVTQAVQLLESALVQIPTVVGWLKPVILLPASALTGLTTEQLEAILAHELAHIKRFDYLVNIIQTIVEILGFYHPAVWWISHKIRHERENCCDDIAVAVCGDKIHYAKALASMEEIRGRDQFAIAATGGNLFSRICRLIGKDSSEKNALSWIPALTVILLLIALAIPTTIAFTSSRNDNNSDLDAEAVLNKVRQAQRPFDNMQIEWHIEMPGSTGFLAGFGNPPTENEPILTKRKWIASLSGNSSMLHELQESYYSRDPNNPGHIMEITYAFDGSVERRLEKVTGVSTRGRIIGGVLLDTGNPYLLQQELFGNTEPAVFDEEKIKGYLYTIKEGNEPDILILDFHNPNGSLRRHTIDKSKGYNVIKYECIRNNGTTDYEDIIKLKQYPNGLWFFSERERYRYNFENQNEKFLEEKVIVSDVKFGENIPSETFSINYPEGTNFRIKPFDYGIGNDPSMSEARPKEDQEIKAILDKSTVNDKEAFGPVIERTIHSISQSKNCFIDFDTGNIFDVPKDFLHNSEHGDWFEQNGIDATIGTDIYYGRDNNTDLCGLSTLHCMVIPVSNERWDKVTAQACNEAFAKMPLGQTQLMSAAVELPTTYLFQTLDNRGILQILESKKEGGTHSIKIQYKLIQDNKKVSSAEYILGKMLEHRSQARNIQYVSENNLWQDPKMYENEIQERIANGGSEVEIAMLKELMNTVPENRYQVLQCTIDNAEHVKIELTNETFDSSGEKVTDNDLMILSWNGQKSVQLSKHNNYPASATIEKTPNMAIRLGHPWRTYTGELCNYLEKAIKAEEPVKVEELEDSTYRISFNYQINEDITRKIKAIVDPSQGYVCTLEDKFNQNGELQSQSKAKYEEVAEGFWFPISGETVHWDNKGLPIDKSTVTTSNIVVNDPDFNISYFDVDIPIGTTVNDRIQDTKYVSGADREHNQNALPDIVSATEDFDPNSWEEKFNSLYSLKDGEVLKRISSFIPERHEYLLNNKGENSVRDNMDLHSAYVFLWDGNLESKGAVVGGASMPVSILLQKSIGLMNYDFNDPEKILRTSFAGDWIVRKDASKEEVLAALEKMFKDEMGREIKFIKQNEENEVIIAKGKYNFQSLPNVKDDEYVLISTKNTDTYIDGVGGGTGTISKFLPWIGRKINMNIIDNTESKDTVMSWRNHDSSNLGNLEQNSNRYNTQLDMLLKNLNAQTGLTFERTSNVVEKWFVSENGKLPESTTLNAGSIISDQIEVQPIINENPNSGTKVLIEAQFIQADEIFLEQAGLDSDSLKNSNKWSQNRVGNSSSPYMFTLDSINKEELLESIDESRNTSSITNIFMMLMSDVNKGADQNNTENSLLAGNQTLLMLGGKQISLQDMEKSTPILRNTPVISKFLKTISKTLTENNEIILIKATIVPNEQDDDLKVLSDNIFTSEPIRVKFNLNLLEPGQYVEINNNNKRKIIIQQVRESHIGKTKDDFPAYAGYIDFEIRSNFDLNLTTKRHTRGMFLEHDNWDASFTDPNKIIGDGSYLIKTLMITAWKANVYGAVPNHRFDDSQVNLVEVQIKPVKSENKLETQLKNPELKENFELLDIDFKPVHSGINEVYIKVKNKTEEEQIFGADFIASSPDENGEHRIGSLMENNFMIIEPQKTEIVRAVYKFDRPFNKHCSLRLTLYNPPKMNDKYNQYLFFFRKFDSNDMKPSTAETIETSPANQTQVIEINRAFRRFQNYLVTQEYDKAWELLTEDYKIVEFHSSKDMGLEIFNKAMKQLEDGAFVTWDKQEFLQLLPGKVSYNDDTFYLAADYDDQLWIINFKMEDGQYKINWIEGYTPGFLKREQGNKTDEKLEVPAKQVLFEIKLLEVNEKYLKDEATLKELLKGVTIPMAGMAMPQDPNKWLFSTAIIDDSQIDSLFNQKSDDIKKLAVPALLVLDNEEATISKMSKIPYVTGYTEPGNRNEIPVPVIEQTDIGFTGTFTPHITDDNDIVMELALKNRFISGYKERTFNEIHKDKVPLITQREMESTALIFRGKTLIANMGEVKPDPNNPESAQEKKNLIVLIKPTVISSEQMETQRRTAAFNNNDEDMIGPSPNEYIINTSEKTESTNSEEKPEEGMVQRVYDISDLVGMPSMGGMMGGMMGGYGGGGYGGGMMGGYGAGGGYGGGMMDGYGAGGGYGGGMMGGYGAGGDGGYGGSYGGGMMGGYRNSYGSGYGMGMMRTNSAQELKSLIMQLIEPESWYELNEDGKGTIYIYPAEQPKKMTVTNTIEVHKQIEKLLESLRKSFGNQVSLEIRYVYAGEQVIKDFLNDVSDSKKLTITGVSSYTDFETIDNAILDDLELSFLIKAAKARNLKSVTAPNVTVFDGETAEFSSNDPASPFNISFKSRPVISHDKTYVIFDMEQTISSSNKQSAETISKRAMIPDGQTLAYICQANTSAGSMSFIVFVRPTIILQEESEASGDLSNESVNNLSENTQPEITHEGMVQRTYDIADLIGMPSMNVMMGGMMSGMGGGMMGGFGVGPMSGGYGGMSGSYGATPNQAIINASGEFVQKLMDSVEPDSWYDNNEQAEGTIYPYPASSPKKLAVTNTPEIQTKVEEYLETLRESIDYTQVAIEMRFIYASEQALNEMQNIAKIENIDGVILDDTQVRSLIRGTQNNNTDAKSLTAPRVTVLNGETALFTNIGQQPVPVPPEQINQSFRITPQVSEDKQSVMIDFSGRMTSDEKNSQQLPKIDDISLTNIMIPNGQTYALSRYVDNNQDSSSDKKSLIILIKPTIILQEEEPIPGHEGSGSIIEENSVAAPQDFSDQSINSHIADSNRVLIETQIIQVSSKFLRQLGLDAYSLQNSNTWTNYRVDNSNEPNLFVIDELSASLLRQTIDSQKGSKVEAKPAIIAATGKQAEIKILQEEYYIFVSNKKTDSSLKKLYYIDKETKGLSFIDKETNDKKISRQYLFKFTGGQVISLKPEILDDKNIQLELKIDINDVIANEQELKVNDIMISDGTKPKDKMKQKLPKEVSLYKESLNVLIPDGKSLLIIGNEISSGITHESKVPILGDLPLLDRVFSSSSHIKEEYTQLFLVKPTILSPEEAEKIWDIPPKLESINSFGQPIESK